MMNIVNYQATNKAISHAVFDASLSEADKTEAVNTQKELVESIDKMILAISSNKSVQKTANDLTEKNWWSSFKGTVSGTNDKDLAGMVKNLGGSLETTQAVVQVMLRLQTRKDHLLRGFHSVLVDKIIKIQADTRTLDANQRSAAIEIVSALQDQIEDQLRQYEAVDRHELRLKEVDDVLAKAVSVEVDFRAHFKALDDQCVSLKNSDTYLSNDIVTLQLGLKNLTTKITTDLAEAASQTHSVQAGLRELEVKQTADSDAISASQSELRGDIERVRRELTSATDALAGRINQQAAGMTALEARLTWIEAELARGSTWSGRLRRHSFGIVGVLTAIATMVVSFRM